MQCNVTNSQQFSSLLPFLSNSGGIESFEICRPSPCVSSVTKCRYLYLFTGDMLLRLVFPSNFGDNHESPFLSSAIGGFIRFIPTDTDTTPSAFILPFRLGPLLFLDLTLNVAAMIVISTSNNVRKFKFYRL